MASSYGRKKFLEIKSLFFVMYLGCIFVKIKVAFAPESYTPVSQNIQIYFAALQLDAAFDGATKPERMLASTGKITVGQKICGNVGHNCCSSTTIISWNYLLRWLLSH